MRWPPTMAACGGLLGSVYRTMHPDFRPSRTAQMEEHWFVYPEVSGLSSGQVKFSLPVFFFFQKIMNKALISVRPLMSLKVDPFS